jgi:hypothetical protein
MNQIIPLKTETVICLDNAHCHKDARQDIMHIKVCGHTVTVESERGSFLYTVWIDGAEKGAFMPFVEVDRLLQGLQP